MNAAPPSAAIKRIVALFEARTGQTLSAARSGRIESSLRMVMRDAGAETMIALDARIAAGDARLANRVIDALLNNETSFYRDTGVFDLLASKALPAIAAGRGAARRLRIWSAGCSTGQEPYSLALMLHGGGPLWADWAIDILATDLSSAAIAQARTGRYSQFEIQRGMPIRTMIDAFSRDGEDWVLDPAIRAKVRFGAHNVLDMPPGRFDIILCRNVLMYFPLETRARIFDRLATALEPGGILMLGAGETVIGQTARFAAHPEWRGLYAAAADRNVARAA